MYNLDDRPPPPPPASSKPPHRANSSARAQASRHNDNIPSHAAHISPQPYTQPAGKDAWDRSIDRRGMHTHSQVQDPPPRSPSRGERTRTMSASAGPSRAPSSSGRTNVVFCDVVMDGLSVSEDDRYFVPPEMRDFVKSLGTDIEPESNSSNSSNSTRPNTPTTPRHRPSTSASPIKPEKRLENLRQWFRELWMTEQKYLEKIFALNKEYAVPLRMFAKSPITAIISQYEAGAVFSNIEMLVPIAQAFENDLASIAAESEQYPNDIPRDFGRAILHHIRQMAPYQTYLRNYTNSTNSYARLMRENSGFASFVDSTNIAVRETVGAAAGGLGNFLAEPFQRLGRYKLLIDLIVNDLAVGDVNILPLEEALVMLKKLADMGDVSTATQRCAMMWALNQTIDGFPPSLVRHTSPFIRCLDVSERYETTSGSNTLRCTLFLFHDKLLLVKRPAGDKGALHLTGLINIDDIVNLYESAGAGGSNSPKKLKKGVMGYRGKVDVLELFVDDLGGIEFGLVFENPPQDQSDRWCDRPARRFTVANTYADDVKLVEKEIFLRKLAEAQMARKMSMEFSIAKKSARIWHEDGSTDSTVVYWSISDKTAWEQHPSLRGRLALHLVATGKASQLEFGPDRLQVVVRLDFLGRDQSRLVVRSRDGAMGEPDIVPLSKVINAVNAIATSYRLFTFPEICRPSTPSGSTRSRPRSLLFSAAKEALLGSSTGVKRGHSMTSKTSTVTSTSHYSEVSSEGYYGTSNFGSFSPVGTLTKLQTRRSLEFKQNSLSRSMVSTESTLGGETTSAETDNDDEEEILRSARAGSAEPAHSPHLRAPSRTNRRRSHSLPPPPQPRLLSPTPTKVDNVAHTRPSIHPHQQSRLSPLQRSPSPFEEAVSTSPIEYRPQTTRRRLMGPRAPGDAPGICPDISQSATPASAGAPFEREASPTPMVDRRSSPPSKRTLEAESPRASPAKKAALVTADGKARSPTTALGALTKPRIPSGGVRGRVTSNSTARRCRRITSDTSTIRASPPPETAATPSTPPRIRMQGIEATHPEEFDLEAIDDDESIPLERLASKITQLRRHLAHQLEEKENNIVSTPGSLSRSPHTRNIHAKLRGDLKTAVLSGGRPLDVPLMLKAMSELSELVDGAREAAELESQIAPSQTDLDILSEERELLGQEMDTLKAEVTRLQAEKDAMVERLDKSSEQCNLYKSLFDGLRAEMSVLFQDFLVDLESVKQSLSGTLNSREEALAAQLNAALTGKAEAKLELAQLRRDVVAEMREKNELLRKHGIIE